jgi:CRISPR-associated protein Cas2
MSVSERKAFLIAYDIADAKRLARVHRCLRNYAAPVQYSVFLGLMSERELDKVLGEVAGLIEGEEDDVRAYPVPERCEAVTLGRQYLPEGVLLAEEGWQRILGAEKEEER